VLQGVCEHVDGLRHLAAPLDAIGCGRALRNCGTIGLRGPWPGGGVAGGGVACGRARALLEPTLFPQCCKDVSLVPGIGVFPRGGTAGVTAGRVLKKEHVPLGCALLAGCA
jgi:hypothetical protein